MLRVGLSGSAEPENTLNNRTHPATARPDPSHFNISSASFSISVASFNISAALLFLRRNPLKFI